MRTRVLLATVLSVTVLTACSASHPAATSTSQASATKTAAPTDPPVPQPSPLHWGACPSGQTLTGLQCATLKVPLDYRKPTGTKITLQLSRAVHTSSARQYLGAMLTDPGGPGGSGLAMPYISTRVPHGVGSRFDWIGWDPRGVGQSRPALHCIPRYFGTDRPPYAAAGTRSYWLRQAKRYAAACGRNGGALLQHMTTEDNARDMDVIRQALRQSAISYYGFSWGTYLGQVYATLFPQRIKRLVLDGVVDPTRDWYAANLDQDVSFERAIKIFFGWVAAHHDVYRLGTTAAAVYATFRHELATLTARPGAGGRLGPDELTDVMLDAGYFTPDWAQDASLLSRLVNDGDASGVLNAYLLRNSGPGNENQYAVYAAVQCTDFAWPAWPKTLADNVRLARTAPFETWGNAWYNAPCLTWPVPPHQPVAVRAAAGLPSILLIAETYDAATPFPGALAARAVFPSSSLIEGVGGTMHAGSLNGVGCTDEAIAQYLATGRTPARRPGRGADLRCPHVPRPPASLS